MPAFTSSAERLAALAALAAPPCNDPHKDAQKHRLNDALRNLKYEPVHGDINADLWRQAFLADHAAVAVMLFDLVHGDAAAGGNGDKPSPVAGTPVAPVVSTAPPVTASDNAAPRELAGDDKTSNEEMPATVHPTTIKPLKLKAGEFTSMQNWQRVPGAKPEEAPSKHAIQVRVALHPEVFKRAEPQNLSTDCILVFDNSHSTTWNGAREAGMALLREMPGRVKVMMDENGGTLHRIPKLHVLCYGGTGNMAWETPSNDGIDLLHTAESTNALDRIAKALGGKHMGGTNTTEALIAAVSRARSMTIDDVTRPVHILLVTDGDAKHGTIVPEKAANEILAAMQGHSNICLSAIAVGEDVKGYEYLAKVTGPGVGNGIFTFAPTPKQLATCFTELIEPICTSLGILQLSVYDAQAYHEITYPVKDRNGVPIRMLNMGLLTKARRQTVPFDVYLRKCSFLLPGFEPSALRMNGAHIRIAGTAPMSMHAHPNDAPPTVAIGVYYDPPDLVPPFEEQVTEEWVRANNRASLVAEFHSNNKRKAEQGDYKGADPLKKMKDATEEFIQRQVPEAQEALRTELSPILDKIKECASEPAYRSLGADDTVQVELYAAGLGSMSQHK